jgi:NAD(P)-dependent dehydrogenase (short-subunit alcohol dehydrogenase family)
MASAPPRAGANHGIGAAIAKDLAFTGYHVVITWLAPEGEQRDPPPNRPSHLRRARRRGTRVWPGGKRGRLWVGGTQDARSEQLEGSLGGLPETAAHNFVMALTGSFALSLSIAPLAA